MQRERYLVDKIIASPQELINAMPKNIGSLFQGEWAMYSCSMLALSLKNIGELYPEMRTQNTCYIKKLIDIVMSPELQAYDSKMWEHRLPLEHISEDIGMHMSYYSILAWMITNYKLSGGGDEYDTLLDELCYNMAEGMMNSPSLSLPTYSDLQVFVPDMLVAIVALNNYGKLYNDEYKNLVEDWVDLAKRKWIDQKTGLLVAYITYNGDPEREVRGSYAA